MKLKQQLANSLQLTQSLQRSIEILQTNQTELRDLININLHNNPLLEEIDQSYDEESYISDYELDETNLSQAETLQEHLTTQLNYVNFNDKQRIMAMFLINSLDERGYLDIKPEEACKHLRCTMQELQEVLQKLQDFEPSGIFAQDLAQCLKLQLAERNLFNNKYELLLQNLPMLAARKYNELCNIINITAEDLRHMVNIIKTLNPTPGDKFAKEIQRSKICDVIATRDENGKYTCKTNNSMIPHLKINDQYKALTKEEKKQYQDQYLEANNLLYAIKKRSETTLIVSEAILHRQQKFLEQGIAYIKPMTLQDIADETDMHMSTISRIVANKSIFTHHGVLPMKYFFTSKVLSKYGDEISSVKVKDAIAKIIKNEPKGKALSDQKISEMLCAMNFGTARRTVAKYREEMNIPSANIRKRAFFQLLV